MKIFKYLTLRIIILILFLTLLNKGAYYILPTSLQESKFSFISEVIVILRFSLVFVVLFICFTLYEINNYKNNNEIKLRNTAIIFCALLFVLLIPLVMYNIKY